MEGREEVAEEVDAVCSVRMVVLWAMQELSAVSLELQCLSGNFGLTRVMAWVERKRRPS